MKKTVSMLFLILLIVVLISTIFGSSHENFESYGSATCTCPLPYKYDATANSGKRCELSGSTVTVSETCTCPDKFVYDGPAAAATRCYKP